MPTKDDFHLRLYLNPKWKFDITLFYIKIAEVEPGTNSSHILNHSSTIKFHVKNVMNTIEIHLYVEDNKK